MAQVLEMEGCVMDLAAVLAEAGLKTFANQTLAGVAYSRFRNTSHIGPSVLAVRV